MLGKRRGQRANINPALGQCIVFAGIALVSVGKDSFKSSLDTPVLKKRYKYHY